MQKVIIVIPIHKPDPTKNELASFAQCYKVLGSHPICVVAPEGLNTEAYTQVVKDSEFLFIDKTWLSSIEQYNKLKISLYFYNLFKDYEYLLTYELDAWVFRDELLYWCDKGYDYIGAPWFEGYLITGETKFKGVGNSGFSLRNISKIRKIFRKITIIKYFSKFWFKSRLDSFISFIDIAEKLPFGLAITRTQYLKPIVIYEENYFFNEDYFWSEVIPGFFKDFEKAPINDGMRFSFEVNPSYLFELNGQTLPFGCHGWARFGKDFWKRFIK